MSRSILGEGGDLFIDPTLDLVGRDVVGEGEGPEEFAIRCKPRFDGGFIGNVFDQLIPFEFHDGLKGFCGGAVRLSPQTPRFELPDMIKLC